MREPKEEANIEDPDELLVRLLAARDRLDGPLVLRPLGVPRAQLRRIAIAIRSAIGIEAFVWLTDVAGLSREEAKKSMRWTARMILRGVLDEMS